MCYTAAYMYACMLATLIVAIATELASYMLMIYLPACTCVTVKSWAMISYCTQINSTFSISPLQ